MKRFFATLMSLTILLSLTACGQADPQKVAAEKQSFYETYFTEANYKTVGKSVTASNANTCISIIQDEKNATLFEMKVLENYFRLYQLENGKRYVNTILTAEDGTVQDSWGECEEGDSKDLVESLNLDKTVLDLAFENITKIQYLQTADGLDVVQVSQKDPDFIEGTVIKEYCIRFAYDNTDCEMVITSEIDPEGGESTGYNTDKVAEGFEVLDYSIDYENKVLVHWEDQAKNIPFELVSETTDTDGKELVADFYIDEKTKEVSKVETAENDEAVTYTFFTVKSCLEGVTIPTDAEPCDTESLAMLLFAVIFSGANIE